MHNDFTLFLREYPNGSKVYFYYTYDVNGERKGPWTTKSASKVAARNYCHVLIKSGRLIPDRTKAITFGEYSKGFWERGSEYVKNQESRADITDTYINNCNKMTTNQILPFFADAPLEKITDKDVNKWLLGFRERKVEKDGKTEIIKYQNTYANTVFGTFNVMLAEAVRRGVISANPCDKVKRLKNDRKKVTILTVEEVRKLFPDNYKTVWGEKKIAYAVCRLASLTGMRIGEILGLRGEYVFDKHIYICGQYGDEGYLPYTKTKENRKIPLIPEIIKLLRGLGNGNGFVFSLDGGAVPVTQAYTRKAFHQALVKIGIKEAEIKQRALTIHSWRHFLNTELLNQGLSIPQVQGVTGHKSIGMTERYNHLEASQITDVMKAQEAIVGAKKPKKTQPKETGKAKGNSKGLKIVKMNNQKTA
ncbi:MAG: site-specific integrase [Treponema sp.]|nr:site-specific integrase [Treponema sp.]